MPTVADVLTVNGRHEVFSAGVVAGGNVVLRGFASAAPGRNFVRKMADAAELEPAFLMFGTQASQTGQLGVNAGLFDDEWVAGSDGFDFGVSQGGAVNVLDVPKVALPRHHLPDEAGLGFEGLPHIRHRKTAR